MISAVRAILAFLIGFTLMLALLNTFARAHGPAEWINRGRYQTTNGALCCGEKDCHELADGDVTATANGYFVRSFKEIVPYSEAQPSPDGRYWRCAWPTPANRKCFFAPPPAT